LPSVEIIEFQTREEYSGVNLTKVKYNTGLCEQSREETGNVAVRTITRMLIHWEYYHDFVNEV
jgi:hypothetical protein